MATLEDFASEIVEIDWTVSAKEEERPVPPRSEVEEEDEVKRIVSGILVMDLNLQIH